MGRSERCILSHHGSSTGMLKFDRVKEVKRGTRTDRIDYPPLIKSY